MSNRLTALAQLVRLLGETKGMTRTCDLAAATGYSRRSIELAKRELGFAYANPASCETAKPDSQPDANQDAHTKPVSHVDAKLASLSQKEIPPTPPKEKLLPSNLETTVSPRQLDARKPTAGNGRSFWSNVFENPDDNSGVQFVDGRLALVNGTRKFWEDKLGADQLDLALIEIQGGLQANSQTPIKLQVERSLARTAREKLDRDNRYSKAVAANKKPAPARPVALSRF